MRAILQRVTGASVSVDGAVVGSVGAGLCALIGIEREDTLADALWIGKKIRSARLFEVDGKPWVGSIASLKLGILLVSQFTLHASMAKPRPDFHAAMPPEEAARLFDALVTDMRAEQGDALVATGVFRAMMQVSLVNDGPVTVIIDSAERRANLASAAEALAKVRTPRGTPTPVARTTDEYSKASSAVESGARAREPTAASSSAETAAAVSTRSRAPTQTSDVALPTTASAAAISAAGGGTSAGASMTLRAGGGEAPTASGSCESETPTPGVILSSLQ